VGFIYPYVFKTHATANGTISFKLFFISNEGFAGITGERRVIIGGFWKGWIFGAGIAWKKNLNMGLRWLTGSYWFFPRLHSFPGVHNGNPLGNRAFLS